MGALCTDQPHWSILKQLDPIHNQGLQIVLGAFHTSAQSLHTIEAHEPSLTTRQLKLSLIMFGRRSLIFFIFF